MTTIDPSTHWNHNRDGYSVVVADDLSYERVQTKDANDAGWQKGVAYVREDDAETLYIRPQADFLAKFTQDERLGDEA